MELIQQRLDRETGRRFRLSLVHGCDAPEWDERKPFHALLMRNAVVRPCAQKAIHAREFETDVQSWQFSRGERMVVTVFRRWIPQAPYFTEHAACAHLAGLAISFSRDPAGGTIVSLRHFSARYWQGMSVASIMTALPLRLLSVTVGKRESPPNREERVLPRQRLTDWIVPPVIVPLLPFLFVLAVVAWRG
jgi:hypothetical protein